jgi:hypothetical protein
MAEPAAGGPALKQEARVLLAWMSEQQARLALSEGSSRRALTAAQQAAVADARDRLKARAAGIDQSGLIRPLSGALRDHVARLEENPDAQRCFAEGFTPALVDLARVCVFQPQVYIEHMDDRLACVRADDVASVAGLTLPLGADPMPVPQFDQERFTFVIGLANENLHVVGAFGGPAADAQGGTLSVGFQLRVIRSFVQVASVQGRYFLRDGYHRCLGLLRRGVRYAPAFVRDGLPLADLVPPGMLEFETFMGERPPLLPDYWDSGVSCSVWLPTASKVVVIRATELPFTG